MYMIVIIIPKQGHVYSFVVFDTVASVEVCFALFLLLFSSFFSFFFLF